MNIKHMTERLAGVHLNSCTGATCDCGAAPVATIQPAGEVWLAAVDQAVKNAKYVYKGCCNHTLQAIDYMRAVMNSSAPAASAPAQPAAIPIPQNADGAALMLNLAHEWLMEYAPERLRQGGPVPPMSAQPEAIPEAVLSFAIQVEKILCAKLGRQWTTSGISIESLIEQLLPADPAVNHEASRPKSFCGACGAKEGERCRTMSDDQCDAGKHIAAPVPAAPADKYPAVTKEQARNNQLDIDIAFAAMKSAGLDDPWPRNMSYRINVALAEVNKARADRAAPAGKGELPGMPRVISDEIDNVGRVITTAYTLCTCGGILADRARQAAIAQPSASHRLFAIGKKLEDEEINDEQQYRIGAELIALSGVCTSCHGEGQDGEAPDANGEGGWVGLCSQCAGSGLAAAPQPPSTGSIADDAEFNDLLVEYRNCFLGSPSKSRLLAAKATIHAFIDTRTAALIDAASKEQSGDAEALERNLELVITRLEQIAGNFSTNYREDAEQALVCARAIATTKAAQ